MADDGVGKVRFECRRDDWDLSVTVRTVSKFEDDTWVDRTAGETLVEIRATWAGERSDGELDGNSESDQLVVALRAELAAQLETLDGIGELGGETSPPAIHGAEAVSYVDIAIAAAAVAAARSAGKAAGTAFAEMVLAKIRGVLEARKARSGEDWREEQGYL